MDWSNEDYVRVYTRETPDDIDLSWEALALWRTLLLRLDKSGLLPVRNGWSSVARLIRWPVDVVERAGPELVRDGRIRSVESGLFAPNYLAAQTASKSDKQRQKDSRDRRRAEAEAMEDVEIATASHDVSRAVTRESHDVTPSHSLLCSADPLLRVAEPLLIPPIQSAATNPIPAKPSKRPSPLHQDWKPERSPANVAAEQQAGARGVDLGLELQKLHDWAKSKNAKKADWEAAWRNWTRNANPSSGGRSHQNNNPTQVALDELARIEREEMLAGETS